MPWDARRTRDLRHAIRTYDRPTVARSCAELIAEVLASPEPPEDAVGLLDDLRRKRHFDLLQRLADACIQAGLDRPRVRHQYAQALIDQGCLTAAVAILEQLDTATGDPEPDEHGEAAGLLGRAHKQMYVDAGDGALDQRHRHLARAVTAYNAVYRHAPDARWHGINLVALLTRADRDGVAIPDVTEPGRAARRHAAEILRSVDALGDGAAVWDLAVAVEACVALGRHDEAARWLERYVARPTADAFELASTVRQLQEVWQLSPTDDGIGERLIPVLQAELLRREGGELEVGAAQVLDQTAGRIGDGIEKVFGGERFTNLEWFRDALSRCRGVARIEERRWEDGVGTGFLVDGPALHPDLPPTVLLTNAHVLGDATSRDGKDSDALDLHDAVVTLRAIDGAHAGSHAVRTVHWTSPRDALDTTIAELESLPDDVPRLPLASTLPRVRGADSAKTFIIGHPHGGREPLFSIRDNHVLDADDVRIHYRTPTERGSSGSPVFSESWEVIAIHHRGLERMARLGDRVGSYAANEGIWITAIRSALATTQSG